MSGFGEIAVCLGGGEALVPEVDGDAEVLGEHFAEGLSFFSLRAGVAGWVERESDDDFGEWSAVHEAIEVAKVVAAVGAGERGKRNSEGADSSEMAMPMRRSPVSSARTRVEGAGKL